MNVEGVQKFLNNKQGGWNKHGGGDFLKKTSTKLQKMEGGKKSKKSINVGVGKKSNVGPLLYSIS